MIDPSIFCDEDDASALPERPYNPVAGLLAIVILPLAQIVLGIAIGWGIWA